MNGTAAAGYAAGPILVGSSTSSASPVSPGSGIAETVEHPFGTLKMRMGATHFLMKRLPKVVTEMALHVLAYNLTRVMNIVGIQPLMAAMRRIVNTQDYAAMNQPPRSR